MGREHLSGPPFGLLREAAHGMASALTQYMPTNSFVRPAPKLDVLVLVEGLRDPARIVHGLSERGLEVQIAQGGRALENLPDNYAVDLIVFCENILESSIRFDVFEEASHSETALVALTSDGQLRGRLVVCERQCLLF